LPGDAAGDQIAEHGAEPAGDLIPGAPRVTVAPGPDLQHRRVIISGDRPRAPPPTSAPASQPPTLRAAQPGPPTRAPAPRPAAPPSRRSPPPCASPCADPRQSSLPSSTAPSSVVPGKDRGGHA